MSGKDFYVILGISPRESQSGIKSAYRDLAMKYHPDRAGAHMTRQFQEVSEAYQVLSDPRRRADYDRRRHRRTDWAAVPPTVSEPGPPIEPFDAGPVEHFEGGSASRPAWRLSLLEDFLAPQPVRDDLLSRFMRNFTGDWMPKSGRVEALNLGIGLTAEEARWGGEVEIGVPVFSACSTCRGSGHVGYWYPCPQCQETGTLRREEFVRLAIPAEVTDGSIIELPLDGLGIRDLFLRVMIRIGD